MLCWPKLTLCCPMLTLSWPKLPLSCPYVDPMFTYVGLGNALPHSSDRNDGGGTGWGGGGDLVGTGSPQAGAAAGAARLYNLWLPTEGLCFLSVLSVCVFCLCFLSGFAFYRTTKNDTFLSINFDIILLWSKLADQLLFADINSQFI